MRKQFLEEEHAYETWKIKLETNTLWNWWNSHDTIYIINQLIYAWLKTNKQNDPMISVVYNNKGLLPAHISVHCRCFSVEVHTFSFQSSP